MTVPRIVIDESDPIVTTCKFHGLPLLDGSYASKLVELRAYQPSHPPIGISNFMSNIMSCLATPGSLVIVYVPIGGTSLQIEHDPTIRRGKDGLVAKALALAAKRSGYETVPLDFQE